MTESEVFESILGIKEIQVDRVEWQEQSLHSNHPPAEPGLSVVSRSKRLMGR